MGGLGQIARAMLPAIVAATTSAGWLLYAGMGVAAAAILGGNGVPPSDIVHGLRTSMVARLVVYAGWVLVTLPVARASLVVPTTWWLRSLPVARSAFWLLHAVVLIVFVEAPFVALLGAGGGVAPAATAAFVTAAAHALIVAGGERRVGELAASMALVAALASGAEVVAAATGAAALGVGVAAAVARAPELGHVHRRARVFGGATLALATAHVATLWRRERGAIARGAAIALFGGGAAALGVRNNDVAQAASAWRVLLALGGATLPLAVVGVAVAAWHTERRHRWLLDATGTPARRRVHATSGVAIGWGLSLGTAQGALAASLVPRVAPFAALGLAVAAQAAWGAVLGSLVAATVRRSVRDDRRDGERTFVIALPLAIAAAVLAALAPLAALALAGVSGTAVHAAQAAAAWPPPELPPAPVEEPT